MQMIPLDFIDVSNMAAALLMRHKSHFTDETRRQTTPGSPHHDTKTIILRGPETPCSDGPDGAVLMLEAVDELTAHRRGPGNKAAQVGSKGGIQAAKNARKDRPPFTVIKPIWFDRSLDDIQVMKAIADLGYPKEISYTTIWRKFGRRYGSEGRRAAKKQ